MSHYNDTLLIHVTKITYNENRIYVFTIPKVYFINLLYKILKKEKHFRITNKLTIFEYLLIPLQIAESVAFVEMEAYHSIPRY